MDPVRRNLLTRNPYTNTKGDKANESKKSDLDLEIDGVKKIISIPKPEYRLEQGNRINNRSHNKELKKFPRFRISHSQNQQNNGIWAMGKRRNALIKIDQSPKRKPGLCVEQGALKQ